VAYFKLAFCSRSSETYNSWTSSFSAGINLNETETKGLQIVPISAAVAKQLDSGSYLKTAAFVHVCMNVAEVPGGTCTSSVRMVRLDICECQQVRV